MVLKKINSTSYNYINELINVTSNIDEIYYRLFDTNDNNLIINGKISTLIRPSEKLNNLFDLKEINCNIVNIPMTDEILININNEEIKINTLNFENLDFKTTENIIFLSTKTNMHMIFRDIIINNNGNIISICIYKLNKPISKISHGAIIISDISNNNNQRSNSMISYSKCNYI